jgi:hypothetical protein
MNCLHLKIVGVPLCAHPSINGRIETDRCGACEHYAGPVRGLGDVVKKVADATGVSKVAPKGCGCQRRREALNRILPNPLKGS